MWFNLLVPFSGLPPNIFVLFRGLSWFDFLIGEEETGYESPRLKNDYINVRFGSGTELFIEHSEHIH